MLRNKAVPPKACFDLDPPVLAPSQSLPGIPQIMLRFQSTLPAIRCAPPFPVSIYSPGPYKLVLSDRGGMFAFY